MGGGTRPCYAFTAFWHPYFQSSSMPSTHRLHRLFAPRRLLAGLLLAAALLPAGQAAPAPADRLDRVLVIVNTEVITESELNARIKEVRKSIASQKMAAPSEDVLKKQVLERMVLEKIQLQLAAQTGIQVSNERIDQAIQRVAQENRLTPAELINAVKKDGTDPARFRNQIKTQLTLQQLVEREVQKRVSVTDGEVENFLAATENRSGGVEFNAAHILIAYPETATPEAIEAARARADTLWRELKQGADFQQAAIAQSQGQTALEGGLLGWKKSGQLPALFSTTLKQMRPGEISEVLRGPNGFHILKLLDKRGQAQERPVTQAHARHILVRTTELIPTEVAERRIAQLRERLEQGEDFAALARVHSDDVASASIGGDLSWVSPGQASPEFDRAVEGLKLNELSAPVRTPYGVHLIQVLERRERDISAELNFSSARQQMLARKADERYDQWLRQLRDEAYVEYRGGEVK
jgi:peptidyl-prolyl cis-trans isomerase SurA